MRVRYEILIHHSLRLEIERHCLQRKGFRDALEQAMRELSLGADRPWLRRMSGIRDPHWRRSVRRIRVGGRRGYRMIFCNVAEDERVIPVFVSSITRGEGFEYAPVQWHGRFHTIFGHYQADTHEFGQDFSRYRYFTPWPVDD